MKVKIKYDYQIKDSTFENYVNNYLISRIYKLLPLYEEEREWEIYLSSLNQELCGANELLLNNEHFLVLIKMLEGLPFSCSHKNYRKTVFDCISYAEKLPRLMGDKE